MVLSEAVSGLLMGLSVQIVLEGAQLAGQLAGAQLGFSLAAIIDPQTNIETPVLTIFYQMIALLIFLQLDVHHWILRAVVKSFAYFPVGTGVLTLRAARELLRAAGAMWLIGVQIAAPILLATMVIDVTIGFLSKASPQLPAMFIGISAKSLAGYALLAASVGLWPVLAGRQIPGRHGLDGARAGAGALSDQTTWPTTDPKKPPRAASRRPAKKARWCARAIWPPRSPCSRVTLALSWQPQMWIGRWRGLFERLLAAGSSGEIGLGTPIFSWTLLAVAQWLAPMLALALAVALLTHTAQGGFVFATEALQAQLGPPQPREQHLATSSPSPGSAACCARWCPSAAIVALAVNILERDFPQDRPRRALRLPRTARAAGLAAL